MPTEPETALTNPLQDERTAISLEGVSVLYRVPRERVSGIKEYTIRFLQRRLEYEEFWALRDISFQVRKGEVFGVIGKNGSGKSTLLKVIARVLMPQKGRVVMRGKVAPLLELGAGFQFELTGRENIFLNSAILGRTSQETEDLLGDIIEFAEIGDFIDAPLRTYSTGMVARLGFAVATCLRPDILLVDEVLSVGDAQFQEKCLNRMYSFLEQGTTVIFVSHGMATIESFCNNALWLDGGVARAIGPTSGVVERYIETIRPAKAKRPIVVEKPAFDAAQLQANLQDYTPLTEVGSIYPTAHTLNLKQGALSVWMKLLPNQPHPDSILFHTSDSRFVLYTSQRLSMVRKKDVLIIIARAGGNRRVLDPYSGKIDFPEVTATLETDGMPDNSVPAGIPFSPGEWHLVCMTWHGYPSGIVRLHIDAKLAGEFEYDSRYDDGRSLPSTLSVGMRPALWMGEIMQNEDGSLADSRPISAMSVAEGGVEIKDMRIYQRTLTSQEIQALNEHGLQDQ